MTVVVRIRRTDKKIEIEGVINFRMDTNHFWLTLKGDNYRTFWRRNVELVRIKEERA